MSNMSYCRFENTSRDLADCLEALKEMVEGEKADDKLGREELRAAKSLAVTCLEIVELLAEHAEKDLEDVDTLVLEDAVESINDECDQTDDDEE